jgi:predicted nucleotidyltransferase
MELSKEQEIIKILFKDFLTPYNSRSISKLVGISHAGAFKILKKLEKREIVKSKRIGNTLVYSLNFDNPITNKEIEMVLLLESQNFKRWIEEFKELKDKLTFFILFGSITRNEKEANDIDILVMADKNKLNKIKKIIAKIQGYTNKKIHLLIQTHENFKKDVNEKNKVMLEIIKTGIILYGNENYRKILNELNKSIIK